MIRRLLRFASFLAPAMAPVYEFVARRVGDRVGAAVEFTAAESYEQLAWADVSFVCGLAYVELGGPGRLPLVPYGRPYKFVAAFTYDLPFGQGKRLLNHGGVIDRIIGGWQVNGIVTYSTGVPIQVSAPQSLPWGARLRGASVSADIPTVAGRRPCSPRPIGNWPTRSCCSLTRCIRRNGLT